MAFLRVLDKVDSCRSVFCKGGISLFISCMHHIWITFVAMLLLFSLAVINLFKCKRQDNRISTSVSSQRPQNGHGCRMHLYSCDMQDGPCGSWFSGSGLILGLSNEKGGTQLYSSNQLNGMYLCQGNTIYKSTVAIATTILTDALLFNL